MNNAAAVLMDSEPGSENETAPVVEQPKLVPKTPAKKAKVTKKAKVAKLDAATKAHAKTPAKAQPKKVKAAAKIEPKLPQSAIERLRNGTSSIPLETKTLGMTYAVIQRALKRELGAAGYSALIKANRAAKSKVTKPKAAKKSKPAKAAGKKSTRAKAKK